MSFPSDTASAWEGRDDQMLGLLLAHSGSNPGGGTEGV